MTGPQDLPDAPRTGNTPSGGPRDASTATKPGTGVADQAKPPTTQISGTPSPSQEADPKKVLDLAKSKDVPQPGEGDVKHFGKAGSGVQEVGKDTGIEPGKNVGLQTVSAEAHALALNEIDKSRVVARNSRKRLTEEQLRKMSPAEIRAVATDREYEVNPGGRRSTLRAFMRAQEEDETLEDAGSEE